MDEIDTCINSIWQTVRSLLGSLPTLTNLSWNLTALSADEAQEKKCKILKLLNN